MARPISAMDLWFYTSAGTYDFDVRCEMLAELGYDGIYATLWSDEAWEVVPRLGDVRERFGIEVTGAFAYLEGPEDAVGIERIERFLAEAEGCRRLELAVLSAGEGLPASDPRGDAAVLKALEPLLDAAARGSATISLYPHQSWWLQTSTDALRLAGQLQHPALRAVFSGYHWYAADGRELGARIEAVASLLDSVNVSGARRSERPPTVEELGKGELDNFTLLGKLRRVGYEGPVHLFGYGVGGDVYAALRRSLATFREIEQRLDAHPGWSAAGTEVFPYLPAVMELEEQEEELHK